MLACIALVEYVGKAFGGNLIFNAVSGGAPFWKVPFPGLIRKKPQQTDLGAWACTTTLNDVQRLMFVFKEGFGTSVDTNQPVLLRYNRFRGCLKAKPKETTCGFPSQFGDNPTQSQKGRPVENDHRRPSWASFIEDVAKLGRQGAQK